MRMRRLATILAVASVASIAGGVASAQAAALQIGIGETRPTMFTDPLFQDLGIKRARIVVPWDAIEAASRGDNVLAILDQWMAAAQAAGVEPLVTLEHSRGAPLDCRMSRNRRAAQCRLPSAAAYRSAFQALLTRFPTLSVIAPFNEINHPSQPTVNNPATAAQYTNIASQVCKQLQRKCKLVAIDVLDQADRPAARRPTFAKTQSYIKRFRRALKVPRGVCGIHNYSDVNRFRSTGTRALTSALGCRQYWLTETGGLFKFGRSFPASESRQAKATRYMFRLAHGDKKIRRLYIFNWFGKETVRFDAGLVVDNRPRKAYNEVKRQIR
jgi:hypothetical protein